MNMQVSSLIMYLVNLFSTVLEFNSIEYNVGTEGIEWSYIVFKCTIDHVDWGTKYHNSREIVSHIIPEYAIDEVNIDTIYYL